MQPGRNIAAGISSASQSIAAGIEKYGAMRERDTVIRGKVEAVVGQKMKQGGADSWFNSQSEDTQRLLVKFQGGKESHDDLLKLGSYLDASETISQRDEAAKMQKLVYDTQMLNLQKAQGMAQDDEALRKASQAGMAAPDAVHVSRYAEDVTPEFANQAIGDYYSGDSEVKPSGIDISKLVQYNAEREAYLNQDEAGIPNPRYSEEIASHNLALSEQQDALMLQAINAAKYADPKQSAAADPAMFAKLAAAKEKVASLKANAPKQSVLLPEPAVPELSMNRVTTQSTSPTSTEQFGVSLKHLTESGRATPKTIEALREMFGIADAKVESVNGITLVTQGGKIVQALQNKNANDDLKPLTAEENKKLEAIQSSEGDIDRIEEALKAGNSGVVVGMLQKLWPWAVDSKKVEAMRNAAVPNLARGVFGEVGVLTETDVKRYIAMIPGLNSSPTQQATLIKELRTKLAATKLNSIQSLAAGNRDVSGWVSGMTNGSNSSGGGKRVFNASGKEVK